MTAYEAAQYAYHEAAHRMQSAAENRVAELVHRAYPDAVEVTVLGDWCEMSEVRVDLALVIGHGGVVLGEFGEHQTDAFAELADELVEPFGYLTVVSETDWLGLQTIPVVVPP